MAVLKDIQSALEDAIKQITRLEAHAERRAWWAYLFEAAEDVFGESELEEIRKVLDERKFYGRW